MSRLPRLRRGPDQFASAHDRARVRAAERVDGPLGLAESGWLDDHLASCAACSRIADSYESDRLALRGLRTDQPEPPRDLWARTAAAIEREATSSGGRRPAPAASSPRRIPLGALSGVAVIAVVVGASVISNSVVPQGGGTAADGAITEFAGEPYGAAESEGGGGAPPSDAATRARPTPFHVGAGEVQWVRAQDDGTLAYNVADVQQVCPAEAKEGCATLREDADSRISIDAEAETIIASPDDETAVVVSRVGTDSQELIVVDLEDQGQATESVAPTPAPTEPPPSPDADPDPDATGTAAASADAIAQSPGPDPTTQPEPTGGETAVSEPPDSAAPSDTATDAPGTASASAAPTTTPGGPSLVPSPEPTVAARLAIASDIEVVGESAAFSSDGSWFAFTATGADGAGGPDVYLWKVGEEQAEPITDDGRSVFASWQDGSVIVSRPLVDGGDAPTAATNILIDPETGAQRDGPAIWRPVLDPTRRLAVGWDGTILADEDGMWHPAEGRLVVRAWSGDGTASVDDGTSLTEGSVGDFDVRWDESGTWFAVWIADGADPGIGQLDLYRVDPATGAVDQPPGAPDGVRALPGFSIGQGRLAWATPPGQEGEGSRVQIVAWNDEGVGTVETAPGEDVVVIR